MPFVFSTCHDRYTACTAQSGAVVVVAADADVPAGVPVRRQGQQRRVVSAGVVFFYILKKNQIFFFYIVCLIVDLN